MASWMFPYSRPPQKDRLVGDIIKQIPPRKKLVVACIGCNNLTGDVLGPLVGTMLHARLQSSKLPTANIIGTLAKPLEFNNYQTEFNKRFGNQPNVFTIAVDSATGTPEQLKTIMIGSGPIRPGGYLYNSNQKFGDMHIIGVLTQCGDDIWIQMSSTNMWIVVQMAELITDILFDVLKLYSQGVGNTRYRRVTIVGKRTSQKRITSSGIEIV